MPKSISRQPSHSNQILVNLRWLERAVYDQSENLGYACLTRSTRASLRRVAFDLKQIAEKLERLAE